MSPSLLPRPAFVVGLLLVASGCGGNPDDAEDANPSPPRQTASRPDRPPPRSFAPPNEPAPPRPAPPSDAELSEARQARYVEAVQSVDAMLERNCGACHGKAVPTSPCGLRFDHTDDLVATTLLIPLNADASRVVQVIVDGSMPPADVQPRPTPAELDSLRAFIEGDAAFWSRPATPDGRSGQAYADARSNACAPAPGVDAGAEASDAGSSEADPASP